MACSRATYSLLPLLLALAAAAAISPSHAVDSQKEESEEAIRKARGALTSAREWAAESYAVSGGVALTDCVLLYEESERRLRQLTGEFGAEDARAWLSAALTSHLTCIESLQWRNLSGPPPATSQRTTAVLRQALSLQASPARHKQISKDDQPYWNSTSPKAKLLISWSSSKNKADVVVAQDGSGNYNTINGAVAALRKWQKRSGRRLVVYVKSGTYKEHVEINMKNIMFVGDGISKTIITGYRSVRDGFTTFSSATFSVTGDVFWARDITFENTAGPAKHQAVAVTSASDRSVYYRCAFIGHQDTLFAHSLRQFFRDCQIHGTIDFIFGNAATVLQNCDIYVRRPMPGQSNAITAQGREDPNESTGISIHASRVRQAADLAGAKGSFKSYLGRPWKRYSRVVFLRTDLDGLVDPEGWARWSGDFAIDTVFYGEYGNTGAGAATERRVRWKGFHVLREVEAAAFTVERFLGGEDWIGETGVPFWAGLCSLSACERGIS